MPCHQLESRDKTAPWTTPLSTIKRLTFIKYPLFSIFQIPTFDLSRDPSDAGNDSVKKIEDDHQQVFKKMMMSSWKFSNLSLLRHIGKPF